VVGLLISIIGTDGSGKTTLANKLIEELERKGHPARYVWFRFPRFLTFVLLLISRLTGFTKYKSQGNYRIGKHYFHVQPFRTLYPIVVLVDAIVHFIIRVWIPSKLGYILVCDRWVYDIFVDVAIDTQNSHFFHTFVGRVLYSLASQAKIVLLVDAPDEVLNARRPQTRFDPYSNKRRLFYRLLGNLPEVYSINSGINFDITWKNLQSSLEQKIKIDFKASRRTKTYADVKSPLLRKLIQNKCIMLASNWTFQGMLMKTWGERLFLFMLDFIF